MVDGQCLKIITYNIANGQWSVFLSHSISDSIDNEAFGIRPSGPATEGCRGIFKWVVT
jgi:hypothetical protein